MNTSINEKHVEQMRDNRSFLLVFLRVVLVSILLIVFFYELYIAYFEQNDDPFRQAIQNGTYVYQIGTPLSFGESATANPYCVYGFSSSEGTHTWTSGNYAKMLFELQGKYENLFLNFNYIMVYAPPQKVDIYVNGHMVANVKVTGVGNQVVQIRKEYVKNNYLELEFILPDATSPAIRGESIDARLLALGMLDLCISDSEEQPES